LLQSDLLHSVWGSTYATVWYDGHRMFLPRSGGLQAAWGTRLTLIGLLPTLACAYGLVCGIRRLLRALRERMAGADADVPLLILTGVTLAGYVLFTYRNPWFASVKGSYLLGLSVPFAVYASEGLDRWSRRAAWRSVVVCLAVGLLVLAVTIVFAYGLIMKKAEVPGLFWAGAPR
jgi:hypothetical protein